MMSKPQLLTPDTLNLDANPFSLGDLDSDNGSSSTIVDLFRIEQSDSNTDTDTDTDTDTGTDTGIESDNQQSKLSTLEAADNVTDDLFGSLEVTDASTNDNLFDLDSGLGATEAANVGGTAVSATFTAASYYYDPVDYGNPNTDSLYWRQQAGMASCAVVAQISVYESLTGYRISETAAGNYAQAKGWFDPRSGTPLSQIGKVLNALSVKTYNTYNNTINYLAAALQRGDKPIVGLDATEIWYPKYNSYGSPIEQANAGHAVWVTGIDVKANGAVNVILNDSGTPYGKSSVVNYANFYNAWADMGFFASVADNPYT
jgi:hypothetical protein